jgi:mRNA capping enzyme, catalytic domain
MTTSVVAEGGDALNGFLRALVTTRAQLAAERSQAVLEVEARFQLVVPYAVQRVTAQAFGRLKELLEQKQVLFVEHHTTDYNYSTRDGTLRRTVDSAGAEQWLLKRQVLKTDLESLGLRLALSTETVVAPPSAPPGTPYIRTKHRASYPLEGGVVQLDLTETLTERETAYEVEMELVGARTARKEDLQRFLGTLDTVWKWLHDSNQMYTLAAATRVGSMLSTALGTQGPQALGSFNRDVLVQARNLKRADLVYGGLVGNPETQYKVTMKADGFRKLVVFNEDGVWAVMPPYEYALICGPGPAYAPFYGTWLDGEMIPPYRRNASASPPSAPYWFLIFDVLRAEGRGLGHLELGERMQVAKQVVKAFDRDPLLTMHAKEYYPVATVDDLFRVMTELEDRRPLLAYKIDGYMFTPASTPYNDHALDRPAVEQVLVATPSVVKWKPPEELTIDFEVERTRTGGVELRSSQRGQARGVPFRGTPQYPFTEEDLARIQAKQYKLLEDLGYRGVVEFGWNAEERVLEPRRIRRDKPVGNRLEVAQDIWRDINAPVPIAALTGVGEDTTHLEFALDWQVSAFPDADVVVGERTGVLARLRLPGRTVRTDEPPPTVPRVYVGRYPTQVGVLDYILQDTRVLSTPPPDMVVDTWTPMETLLNAYERRELPFYRFTKVMADPDPYVFPVNPTYVDVPFPPPRSSAQRAAYVQARLAAYPVRRETTVLGNTVYHHPSCWVPVAEAPEPEEVPVEPEEVPSFFDEPQPLVEGEVALASVPLRPSLGESLAERVVCPWYPLDVVRLGTLGHSNDCLLHAVLQGYNPEYQATQNANERVAYARRLRSSLAPFLAVENPDVPGQTFFESAANGAVAALYQMQAAEHGRTDPATALALCQALLESHRFLGEEAIALMVECLAVDVYVVRVAGAQVYRGQAYRGRQPQWGVVVNLGDYHYETMGVLHAEGLQAVFAPDDPFLQALASAPVMP